VHLDPRRELPKALCYALGRDHHGDRSLMAPIVVWHARGMPEDRHRSIEARRRPWIKKTSSQRKAARAAFLSPEGATNQKEAA
jgi:hypothetical protein